MTAPDVVALAERALGVTVPPFADPASRRRGVLQYEIRELGRRRRELLRALGQVEAGLADRREELGSLEARR